MRKTIERAKNAQRDRVFVEADREFHQIIIECPDNSYLDLTSQRIDRQLRFIRTICATDHIFDNQVLEDHKRIVDALANRNTDKVTKLMEKHIHYVLDETLRLWPNEDRDNTG